MSRFKVMGSFIVPFEAVVDVDEFEADRLHEYFSCHPTRFFDHAYSDEAVDIIVNDGRSSWTVDSIEPDGEANVEVQGG